MMALDPSSEERAAVEAGRLAGVDVSRETARRLAVYVSLLRQWNPTKNLVAPSTLDDVWRRHVADSLQVLAAAPSATRWADLGSGAGLPGLVIAAAIADRPGAIVHCIESRQGKAAFLREAARRMGVPARVHADRIESVTKRWTEPLDAVTARALAPLADLLSLAAPLLKTGVTAIFLKGQDVGSELTLASKYWSLDLEQRPSATDPQGRVVVIHRALPHAP
ncbi:16S rRNA (guanine(527)-N(7))-methyltransferase RsmG [Phreatobacter sp.]|uniref:16S rRNA (guanine(527)-N(7))-methyltransferase RsmG n=1 Tax=Phreatobacter sp. TaxID=1966341 RepID=UPI003F72A73A